MIRYIEQEMMRCKMIQIAICDDEQNSRAYLKQLIDNSNISDYEITEFSSGTQFLDFEKVFDIVFLDPPYQKGMLVPALKSVLPLMSDYGIIVCEYPPEVEIPQSLGGFDIAKTYRYGKINVSVYREGAKD